MIFKVIKTALLNFLLIENVNAGFDNSAYKFFSSEPNAKLNNFVVNKGDVRVISSDENFWVKYPLDQADHVKCSIKYGRLEVLSSKDSVEITINLNQLEECKVSMGAGVIDIKHICNKSSDINLKSGNMMVHVSKDKVGSLKAKVATGVLNNNSDLLNSLSGKSGECLIPGLNSEISLSGNLKDHDAIFSVQSGVLEIGD